MSAAHCRILVPAFAIQVSGLCASFHLCLCRFVPLSCYLVPFSGPHARLLVTLLSLYVPCRPCTTVVGTFDGSNFISWISVSSLYLSFALGSMLLASFAHT